MADLGCPSSAGQDPAIMRDSGDVSPSSAGDPPRLCPVQPIPSRRLTQFCAAVISHQRSFLCLAALCQEVSFPVEGLFLREKIKTGGGVVTEGEEGAARTWSLWLCLQALPFGYQCLNLPETYSPFFL